MLLFSISLAADEFAIKDGILIKYVGSNEHVVVPEGVTSIGYGDASKYPSETNFGIFLDSGIKSIKLPTTLEYIGWNAFRNCTELEEVIIQSNIKNIGYNAFGGCSSVKQISILGANDNYYAEDNCLITKTGVLVLGCQTSIIPSWVTSIGDTAFSGCTNLTSISLSTKIKSIGAGAFMNCTGLKSFTIPSSVTSIGDRAFYGCSGLTSFKIPSNVTSLGSGVFGYCVGLTDMTIPETVTNLGTGLFTGCSGLKNITFSYKTHTNTFSTFMGGIPESLERAIVTGGDIPEKAFYNLSGFSVTLNSGVTSIGASAFWEFHVPTLPNTLTSIGASAFYGCGVETVVIPDSVTYIGSSAFEYCQFMKNLTIGSGVQTISNYAFSNCFWLENVVFKNKEGWKKRDIYGKYTYYSASDLEDPFEASNLIRTGTSGRWEREE